jgi:hypothetical protein
MQLSSHCSRSLDMDWNGPCRAGGLEQSNQQNENCEDALGAALIEVMDQHGGSDVPGNSADKEGAEYSPLDPKRVTNPTAELKAMTSREVASATCIEQAKANTVVGTIRKPTPRPRNPVRNPMSRRGTIALPLHRIRTPVLCRRP